MTTPAISIQTVGDPEAPPVVFLHGLMGRGKNFSTSAKSLTGFRSLLVDLPNHGASGWTDTFDYADIADAVAVALRGEVGGSFALVGHSLGGKVAMLVALRHPELVERLVVVDIAPVDSSEAGSTFDHLLGSLRALDLGTISSRADADAALADPIPDPVVRGFLLQNLRRDADGFAWQPNLELLYSNLGAIAGFPAEQATFDGPTLWVAGGKSPYITDEAVPAMRALFPRVRRVTVREAGHWVHSERPEEFNAILGAFLEA